MSIGHKIGDLMTQRDMTIGDVCDIVHTNPITLFGVLNDIRTPSDLLIERIAWALRVKKEELIA